MTNLNYSAITALLGWVRSLASWCWRMFTQGSNGGLLAWLAHNWLLLTVVLCVTGLAIDLAVYILRWRPQEVWRSFFIRLKDRRRAVNSELVTITEEDLSQDENDAPLGIRARLTERLRQVTKDDGLDENTRLATYRPAMKTNRSETFRSPVYPTARPDDTETHYSGPPKSGYV